MGYSAEKKNELYEALVTKGYDKPFSALIAKQLCTEWTANRMLGYLRQVPKLREEDIVDEMLAILSDRDRIVQKKEMEQCQEMINEFYRNGFGEHKHPFEV